MSDNFFKMVKALKDDVMLEQEDVHGRVQEYFSEPLAATHLRENFVTIKTYELALSELDKLRDDLCRMTGLARQLNMDLADEIRGKLNHD